MAFPAWVALALPALEYLALSAAFNAEQLGERQDGWALAGHLAWLAVLGACGAIGAAVVVEASPRRFREILLARSSLDARALFGLAVHLAFFAVLWWLSARVFAPEGPPPGHPAVWLTSWVLAAIAVCWTAVAAAIPADRGRLAPELRQALVAGAAIGAAAWVAGRASALLWWPLGPATLRAVESVLSLVLDDPVSDPAQALIGSASFQVVVGRACSGFEGVGLMAVFVGIYLLLARHQLRFPRALLLLPLGLACAWIANVVRLALLVLVGTWVSGDVAVGGFHAKAGWVFFCALTLSLVLLVQRTRFFTREPVEASLAHSATAYLLPFLVMVATALLTGLLAREIDWLYGLRWLATVPLLVAFRRFYRDIRWAWSWTAVAAGLGAAVAFVVLTPRPDAAALQAWTEEWHGLSASGRAAWLAVRLLGSVLVVPLAEELAFRGYLLRRLSARDFTNLPFSHFSLPALLVSSAAFGAVHAGWLGATIAGLIYGIVQVRGGSVSHAVLAHVVSNAAVALYVVGLAQWQLWI